MSVKKILNVIKSNLGVDDGIKGLVRNIAKKESNAIQDSLDIMKKMSPTEKQGSLNVKKQLETAQAMYNKVGVAPNKGVIQKYNGKNKANLKGNTKNFEPNANRKGLMEQIKNNEANPLQLSKAMQQKSKAFAAAGFREMSKGESLLTAYGSLAGEYFWNGATNTQRAARIGTVAGAYALGSSTLRGLSGGDLAHNSEGEKDIAGIPFV